MSAPHAPGWYRDPEDPAQLRHWSGRGWSSRRRSWPAWAISAAEVVADRSWGGLTAGADDAPVLDGPVRPAPLPAAARGSLAEQQEGTLTQRLVRPAGAAGGPAGMGHPRTRAGFEAPVGWMPSRRPLMIFCALVGVAVLMMAATVVGTSGRNGVADSAVGRDASFLTRAASVCDAGLVPLRTSGQATISVPGQTASLVVAGARRSASAVTTVAAQLKALPVAPDAVAPVDAWLDDLGRYATDEDQLASAMAAPGPATSGATTTGATSVDGSSAPTPAELAATQVTGDISRADAFAGSNGLDACKLSVPASGSSLVSIP